MARPENLWLSPASLAKVDDDNYRAFIIDKAYLPFPENQSGSKRLIADTMMSVGIEVDPVDITYAPAPGDTRSGYVTIVIVAKITDGAQLNAKKVWTSHPLARSEPVALPDIGARDRTSVKVYFKRTQSPLFRTCPVAFVCADAAEHRPETCEHFPCLGTQVSTPGRATKHLPRPMHPA